MTLDAQGDPDAVWIFQASSDLVTASGSTVQFVNAPIGSNLAVQRLLDGRQLGDDQLGLDLRGTILASASITVGSGATVRGRLLAANAAGANGNVTLIDDTIIRPTGCTTLETGTGGTPTPPEGTPTDSREPDLRGARRVRERRRVPDRPGRRRARARPALRRCPPPRSGCPRT